MTHSTLSEERKVQLDRLGFDWELRKKGDTWPLYYRSLQEYMNTHGRQMPQQKYVDDRGLKLGVELDNTKEKGWQTGYQQLLLT